MASMLPGLDIVDLGILSYADAYQRQIAELERVLAAREVGSPEVGRILLVEHDPPVITISRREGARRHLLATDRQLADAGVTVAQTDRGGDITYHGPGQLVVYPILDLNRLNLGLHDYMRLLEAAVIDACASFGVPAQRDACATGVWVRGARPRPNAAPSPVGTTPCAAPDLAKICAMGVRVRKWITLHGLALNVRTNLDHFRLIVPCGLVGRPVTSLHELLGPGAPGMDEVKRSLGAALHARLSLAALAADQKRSQAAGL